MNEGILQQHTKYLAEKLQGKTVLVTGAAGLIGSSIVRYIDYINSVEKSKIKCVLVDITDERKKELFGTLDFENLYTFVKCDLQKELPYSGKVDYIIHCAGFSGGSKLHLTNPVKVFDVGIGGTRNLLQFAVSNDCKGFLYVSTYEVYGDTSNDEKIKETQTCNLDTFVLRNCYAEVKRVCESMICAFSAQYGFDVFAARLTSTFGNGVRYHDPRFFAEFARCVINNQDIVLKSHGTTVRSYLDSDDAAIAFLYILVNGQSCNAYNLANSENEISIRDIADRIIRLSGTSAKIRFDIENDTAKFGMRKEGKTVMDTSKIEAIGWSPVYSFDDTLIKLIESIKKGKE